MCNMMGTFVSFTCMSRTCEVDVVVDCVLPIYVPMLDLYISTE